MFCYPSQPDNAIYKDSTLEIAAGQSVAFVGYSGSGKTITIRPVLRFFDPRQAPCISMAGT